LNTVYNVVHIYDTEGGFGDAVREERVVESFEKKEDAEQFIREFSDPKIYAIPYHSLACGWLVIRETKIVSHSDFDISKYDRNRFWWVTTNKIRDFSPDDEDF